MLVLSKYMMQQMIANILATVTDDDFAGVLSDVKMGLYIDSITPDADTLIGDLTEPTYTTYARQQITFDTAFLAAGGRVRLTGDTCQFRVTGGTPDVIVKGYFVATDEVTPKLLWSENFEEPVPLSAVGDAVVVVPDFSLGAANYGSGTVLE